MSSSNVLALRATDLRKSKKPLMEKRRRDRINSCLEELKQLVVDASSKDNGRQSKLEKADILELTVKHLRTIQHQQITAAAVVDPTVVNKYRAGFSECAHEVGRYLGLMDGVDQQVRHRVLSHLSASVAEVASLPDHCQQQSLQVQIPTATPVSSLPGQSVMYSRQMAPRVVSPASSTSSSSSPVLPVGVATSPITVILPGGISPAGSVIPVYTSFTPAGGLVACTSPQNTGYTVQYAAYRTDSPPTGYGCSPVNMTRTAAPPTGHAAQQPAIKAEAVWRPW